jgi:Helix-turn-helix domain
MRGKIGNIELLAFEDLPFSRTTAWRLVRAGKLRCYRIKRRVFFNAKHIEELLENSVLGKNRKQS